MLSVDGRTVTVYWTRQCPVVNCFIAEHQRHRRLGHQQLRTATGGHSAGVSVRTADVVAVVQPGQDEGDDECLVNGRRHRTSNAAQLTKNGEVAGNGFLNVASHAEVGVEVNSKISD